VVGPLGLFHLIGDKMEWFQSTFTTMVSSPSLVEGVTLFGALGGGVTPP
jgi:hypothetical protein